MSWARPLFELQEVELELERKRMALAELERELSDDEELRGARERLRERELELDRLKKRQRSLEWDLDDLRGKIKRLEGKLYGGKITNPKELISIQQDIEQHRNQYRRKEDEVLEVMEEVERLQLLVEEGRGRLEEVEKGFLNKQRVLSQRREELIAEISVLRQKLEQKMGLLDGEHLKLYHQLKGVGGMVVKVEAGRCGGCKLSLSLAEIQRARSQPTFCSTCRSLLYVP